MPAIGGPGFTLAEMLVVVAVVAILAAAAIPLLSANDPQRLGVAAEEAANLLRFALSEAKRSGGYVLVDGRSTAGHLKLYSSDASANIPPSSGTATLADPMTKLAVDLDVGSGAFSRGVSLSPQFRAAGSGYQQLLIGPGLTQLQVFDGASSNKGLLQSGSGVLLTYGSQSALVSLDETTGLVSLP